ncbi:adenylate kinase [Gilvimarinus algae]|uniref:Adenylate kinase n=1 Tax=Gilvimarinus algae TaxID=3058037 RepID=A0ABT8TBZ0_9GAMM|nr:adenylate kinase [Gilvimarinus sp. SDUM040014]MDO3381619.1 adenylate kinase [Gilvimarinus sp. SDUM040014]
MKKVAIFGNAGGGKSTLARRLTETSGLPLHNLDKLQYRPDGEAVPHSEYLKAHSQLLMQDSWIIDGFGCVPSAWERFAAADTLIYIDLPLPVHTWWVTKRFVKGLVASPEGWPQGSSIVKGTLNSYQVLWRCHQKLTPRYRQLVNEAKPYKTVHHLRSARALRGLLVGSPPET